MKNYVDMTVNVVYLSNEDVITTSRGNDLYEEDFFAED